jgi:hypothetical protein
MTKDNPINDLARLILSQMTQTDVDRRIQQGIDATMRQVVNDPYKGLKQAASIASPTKVGSGWAEPKELRTPSKFETELVDAMVRRHVGGPNEPVK